MTDTDPRLEALNIAWLGFGHTEPENFLRMYDALRAFDRAQRKAMFDVDHPRCPQCGERDGFHLTSCVANPAQFQPESEVVPHRPAQSVRSGSDEHNATVPVMRADPPWWADDTTLTAIAKAYSDGAAFSTVRAWRNVVCAVLAFANAQPPIETEIEEAYSAYADSPNMGRSAIRDALIAAAKARIGA